VMIRTLLITLLAGMMVSYFSGHLHCTKYSGLPFAVLEISAEIIQGSGIGPAKIENLRRQFVYFVQYVCSDSKGGATL